MNFSFMFVICMRDPCLSILTEEYVSECNVVAACPVCGSGEGWSRGNVRMLVRLSREREGRLRYNQSGHRWSHWSHFTLEGCRMSKGGHGAAAANVLLLKKSEETRRQENLREAIKARYNVSL